MSHDPIRQEPGESMPGDRPKRRRTGIVLVVVVALALIGFVYWKTHFGPNANAIAARSGGSGGGSHRGGFGGFSINGPLPVVVRAAAKGNLNVYLNGLGAVTPLATVTIRTQITGQLVEIHFKEGQLVSAGDLLAVIDPRPYQVALEQAQGQLIQAQAQLQEAKVDLVRYQKLAEQDSIAIQQVDTQRALVSQYEGLVQTDQAAIDSAKLNLTYCHIIAPVAGQVGLRQVDQGNYVTPTDANGLVVLAQLHPITVIFTLPEDDIPMVLPRLRTGAPIPIEAFDRSETTKLASGTLSTVDNEVDPTTGTFKLRAIFPNDDEQLFPNQFVNIRMLLKVDRGALVIPTSAIERGQQGTFVYVVKPDNTVSARAVQLGTTEGERVGVTKGLALGERVVVDGADKLKEGMQVVAQTAPSGAGDHSGSADDGSTVHHRRRAVGGTGGPGSAPAATDGGRN